MNAHIIESFHAILERKVVASAGWMALWTYMSVAVNMRGIMKSGTGMGAWGTSLPKGYTELVLATI